jgi:photosystem II stability/assembly factor-like uncharacterized protein
VSPPARAGSAPSGFYATGRDAWLVTTPLPLRSGGSAAQQLLVYHTADEGQTWTVSDPISITVSGPTQVYFMDEQHGWLLANLGAGIGWQAAAVFKTGDAGATWQQVSETPAHGQPAAGDLPLDCAKTGLTFKDAVTGWVAGSCARGPLFAYVSYDGGSSWQRPRLPAPPGEDAGFFDQCQCTVQPPVMTGALGFLLVQVGAPQPAAYLYVTDDGGASWFPSRLPVGQVLGAPIFVDADTGWVTDGRDLYVTHDGGLNWTRLGELPNAPGGIIGGPTFADAGNGWLLGDGRLYATRDGGATWSPLQPHLLAGRRPMLLRASLSAGRLAAASPSVATDIEVASGGTSVAIAPGQTANVAVPALGDQILVTMHFSGPIMPESVSIQVIEPAGDTWQAAPRASSSDNTYIFALRGGAPGRLTVQVDIGPDGPPLLFTIQVGSLAGLPSQ